MKPMTEEEIAAAAAKEGNDLVAACIKERGAITGILANENALFIFGQIMQSPSYTAVRAKLRGLGHSESDLSSVEVMAKATWKAKA